MGNTAINQPNPVGRPTKYKPEFTEQAFKLSLLGATDKELADFFEVCEDTVNEWKDKYPEFSVSIQEGKIKADYNVAHKLYDKARGAEWFEEQAFKVKKKWYNENGKPEEEERVVTVPVKRAAPPDTQAISLWLRNRQGGKWRDNQHVEVNNTGSIVHISADLSGLFGLIKDVTARRSGDAIQGDVPDRSLLPAPIRPE